MHTGLSALRPALLSPAVWLGPEGSFIWKTRGIVGKALSAALNTAGL